MVSVSEIVQVSIVTAVAAGALFTLVRPLLPDRRPRTPGAGQSQAPAGPCKTCHRDEATPTARRT